MFTFKIGDEFLNYIQWLKKKNNNLKIIDSHVHPLDVMGEVFFSEYEKNSKGEFFLKDTTEEKGKEIYRKPGLSEVLKFNSLSSFLSRQVFTFFPGIVNSEVRKIYKKISSKRVLDEMRESFVDNTVFLPVEPWSSLKISKKVCDNKNFFFLTSFDIYNIKKEEIEDKVRKEIKKYKIIGIKLHPNLQGFKPLPKDNPDNIAEILRTIYKVAEKYNLYLLFHGGSSIYTHFQSQKENSRYKHREKKNALLENFCDKNGYSEVFDLKVPVIIAHLGHFGMKKINYKLVEKIVKNNSNVYFDTSGSSPFLIRRFIELIGSSRIILGSDALYNKMIYAIYFVYLATKKVKTTEGFDEIMINILGKNYYKKILCRK